MNPALFLAMVLTLAAPCLSQEAEKDAVMQPRTVVEIFSFPRSQAAKTARFAFDDERSGYTLRTAGGQVIHKNILYVKTFGGRPATPSVHLIDSRYVVYPETVADSDVPDTLFHDMMAVTHVYDLQRGKLIHTSEPYQYDHDVPLRYDVDEILLLGMLEEAHDKKPAMPEGNPAPEEAGTR